MSVPGFGRVERTLYRSLLRLANSFDQEPVLKALICRNHGLPLPEPLDGLVARFLGSPAMHYYWPPPPGHPVPRVAHAVRDAFRKPPEGGGLEGAFQGIRYLSGLLAVAQKHRILGEAAAAAAGSSSSSSSSDSSRGAQAEQQQQGQQGGQEQAGPAARSAAEAAAAQAAAQAAEADEPSSSGSEGSWPGRASLAVAPVRGSLLVAHPCLAGNIFARSVVLVCRHDVAGSYGLIVNKPLGSSLQHLHERLRQLQGGGGAAGATAGGGAAGAGGLLFGGGPGGTWEAAGAGGSASGSELEAASGDLPAEQLQQMVDFLAWKQEMRGAAAAAAAAAASAAPEYDEYGNWIEQPYTELDDEELGAFQDDSEEEGEEDSEDEDGGPASLPIFLMSGPGGPARGAAGVGVGLAPAPAGSGAAAKALEEEAPESGSGSDAEGEEGGKASPDLALLMHEMGMALLNSKGGAPSEEWGVGPEGDPKGVSAMLRELLRRAGGGSVVMLDPEGNVWSHHLAPSASDRFQLEGCDTYADDEPESVAALVQQCLTQKDRQLLAQHEKLALEQQLSGQHDGLAAAAAATPAHAPASAGAAAEGATAAAEGGHGSAAKAQQLRQRVDRLLSTQQAQRAQQPQQQSEPLREVLEGAGFPGFPGFPDSLFGTAGLFGSSKGGSGSGAAAAGAVGGSSDSKGGTTVSELMSLFKASPLFRGGPVPGVQVLHQRPRLGGQLALPPWGPQPGDAPGEAEQQAATAAVEDAAAEELKGQTGCLEGGLFVGADLSCAQELVEEGYLSPSDLRVCMGDSGWSPGQLEAEVERGTWAVVDATPAFLDLFNAEAARAPSQAGRRGVGGSDALAAAATAEAVLGYEGEMWSRCLRSLGPEFAALAQVPKPVWEDLAELEV
ncbi:hypothetical protein ABPG75_003260 [Micractinium tetrahymenae]